MWVWVMGVSAGMTSHSELILLRRRELMDRRLGLLREGRSLQDDPTIEAEERRLQELEVVLHGSG
jgi:hypothetical protein